jgi:hypothetical protein
MWFSSDSRIAVSQAWFTTLFPCICSRFTLPLEASREIYGLASAPLAKFFRFLCTLNLHPHKSSASRKPFETRFETSTQAKSYFNFNEL